MEAHLQNAQILGELGIPRVVAVRRTEAEPETIGSTSDGLGKADTLVRLKQVKVEAVEGFRPNQRLDVLGAVSLQSCAFE